MAQGERGGEVRHWGPVPHRLDHVRKLVEKLGAGGARLRFCYEAGPCGYGLHRQLLEMGHDCIVVAPSLIPLKAGDRVKTDRRDAAMLAKLHRAGELTAVWVPDAAHEAMRDLVRARAAMRVTGKARQNLQGFLLRHGRIYPDRKGWTGAYRRWLALVRFTHPAQQIVLQDYIDAVADAEARVERLTGQIADLLPQWSLAPVVEAVQAMRGVGFIVAVTVVAEVGDFNRFDNPRQLMAYLGLTPSEHSSGASVRRGGITKAGSGLARRVLIEGAWSCRMQARVSPKLLARLEALPQATSPGRDSSGCASDPAIWLRQEKPRWGVTRAIAREMAGFIWAIAKMVTAAPAHTAGQDAWRKGHSSGRPMRRVGGGTR
ncbi:IS110 family transposase [Paracoccus versutus]|uniref:IS110 family transposase n=1 Tax=Paracoccus versutus TaxID=34007 RepID=UPI001FB8577D|nr:IS110 family transposase [Paracoccus versutus]